MKKTLYLLTILFFTTSAFQQVQAKKLRAFLAWASFISPTEGPYLETHLSIVGKTVTFNKNSSGKYQGSLEITMIFKKGTDVVAFKKYQISSPELDDTTQIKVNLFDLQRFPLKNGIYAFDITIKDLGKESTPYSASNEITIDFPENSVSLSDIVLIESFKKSTQESVLTKGGYDLVPCLFSYYPENVNKLTFYAEIYNTTKIFGDSGKFLTKCFIESFETGKPLNDYITQKKETAKQVNLILREFDISHLPSGNYNLVIEVRDRTNTVVCSNQVFFQRNNPSMKFEIKDIAAIDVQATFASHITNIDSLKKYIRCLSPISSEMDKSFVESQIINSDLTTMQQYFYHFWLTRDPVNPEQAWQKYYLEVQKVEKAFSTRIRRGWETDRGRVYLQYGPPNSVAKQYNEPSAYPYEIWHYYTLGNQRNRKFVFYNPDLVSNDFELLHSDAIGEVQDYAWQLKLNRRNEATNDPDAIQGRDHWGTKAKEFFDNPR